MDDKYINKNELINQMLAELEKRISFANSVSWDNEMDWLAGYPTVHHIFTLSEVAFLFHKLNQFAHQFKAIKCKVSLKICKRREQHIKDISKNVERALEIFHLVEIQKKQELISKYNKIRLFTLFGEQVKAAVNSTKNSHEELRAKRVELIEQFDEFCAEEVIIIRNMVSAFQEDSMERLSWNKTIESI